MSNVAILHKPLESEEVSTLILSPLDMPISTFNQGLDRRKTNRQVILNWIKDNLVEGVDFGIIPTKKGTPKKSLFKSGAERICVLLGVSQSYPAFADYEQAALHNQPFEQIIIRCELLLNGVVVSTGIGARALKDDFGNLNKSLKMAAKSAMILATLSLVGLSEIFTLDMIEEANTANSEIITPEQVQQIESLLTEHLVDRTRFLNFIKKLCEQKQFPVLTELAQLPMPLLATILEKIPTTFANTAL